MKDGRAGRVEQQIQGLYATSGETKDGPKVRFINGFNVNCKMNNLKILNRFF